MRQIRKYSVNNFQNTIDLAQGTNILCVKQQGTMGYMMWVDEWVDSPFPPDTYIVQRVETGQTPPDGAEYIGTVLIHDGTYVAHFYYTVM